MSDVVVRKWEATVARANLAQWVQTYRARVLEAVRRVEGFRDVTFLAEREADPCRVTVLMTWESMDAIRRFAGEDPAKTVLPDFMVPFFATHDARATFHDRLLLETA
ncbi:antibiotic biosynthesis monooxygenase [Gymnodinialimonas sp.]